MLTVKSSSINLTFPTTWDEVTLKQLQAFYRLGESATVRQVVETFCSSPEQLGALPDPMADVEIYDRLTFRFVKIEKPALDSFTIADKEHKTPQGVEFGTLAQKWILDGFISQTQEPTAIELADKINAVYLYPVITGNSLTDASQLDEIMPDILNMSAPSAVTLAGFFLSSWQNLTSSGKVRYIELSRTKKPFWRTLRFPKWRNTASTVA